MFNDTPVQRHVMSHIGNITETLFTFEWTSYNLVLRHRFMHTHYIVWVTVKTEPCEIGFKRKQNHTS